MTLGRLLLACLLGALAALTASIGIATMNILLFSVAKLPLILATAHAGPAGGIASALVFTAAGSALVTHAGVGIFLMVGHAAPAVALGLIVARSGARPFRRLVPATTGVSILSSLAAMAPGLQDLEFAAAFVLSMIILDMINVAIGRATIRTCPFRPKPPPGPSPSAGSG